jgi:hypothetical protein
MYVRAALIAAHAKRSMGRMPMKNAAIAYCFLKYQQYAKSSQ